MCQEPVGREMTEGSSIEFIGYGYRSTSKMAIHKASINRNMAGFFDMLIGCLDVGIYVGAAKNVRGVLRKWTPRDKYFKYQNFPTYLRLSLLLKCFSDI